MNVPSNQSTNTFGTKHRYSHFLEVVQFFLSDLKMCQINEEVGGCFLIDYNETIFLLNLCPSLQNISIRNPVPASIRLTVWQGLC